MSFEIAEFPSGVEGSTTTRWDVTMTLGDPDNTSISSFESEFEWEYSFDDAAKYSSTSTFSYINDCESVTFAEENS